MGVPLTPVNIKRFADGEIYVQILESIRGAYFWRHGEAWEIGVHLANESIRRLNHSRRCGA